MFKLLKKAKMIFLVMFAVFIVSYGSGYLAGKLGWGDYSEYTKTGFWSCVGRSPVLSGLFSTGALCFPQGDKPWGMD